MTENSFNFKKTAMNQMHKWLQLVLERYPTYLVYVYTMPPASLERI